jgi:hypothetical protein
LAVFTRRRPLRHSARRLRFERLPGLGENRWLAGSCLKATKDHADIKRIELRRAPEAQMPRRLNTDRAVDHEVVLRIQSASKLPTP